jgi:hypothetical protein
MCMPIGYRHKMSLNESIRLLLLDRDARKARLKTLLSGVGRVVDALPLSSEDTVNLIEQHLRIKGSSRLLVLIVAAAYEAVTTRLGERVLNLTAIMPPTSKPAQSEMFKSQSLAMTKS